MDRTENIRLRQLTIGNAPGELALGSMYEHEVFHVTFTVGTVVLGQMPRAT
jgi:hypothetical protein